MSNRIEWIDALKGFAIFSVVLGHCVTDSMSSNTFPEYAATLKIIYDFIYSFHMPLFFIISGFVFYISKSYKRFKIKVIDFTIVYILWSSFMWASKYVMAKDVNNPVTLVDLFSIVYKPIMIYWYLYVLIFMYLVVSLLKIERVSGKVLLFSAIIAIGVKFLHLEIGIVNQFLYHIYFFLAGGYCFSSGLLTKIRKREFLLSIFVLLANIFLYLFASPVPETVVIIKGFIIANVASLACFFAISNMKPMSVLVLMGANTLQIYVMHCFFTGGLRVVFKHLACSNIYLYFLLGTLMGIVIPILTARMCKKSPYLNGLFEPLKSLRQLGVVKG